MTTTNELASFVHAVEYDDFSVEVREELEQRVLNSVGIAVGALGEEPVEIVRSANLDDTCQLWGTGKRVSPVFF